MALKDFIEKINENVRVSQAVKIEKPVALPMVKRESIEPMGIHVEGCLEDQRKLKTQPEDALDNVGKRNESFNSNSEDEFTRIFNSAVSEINQNNPEKIIEFTKKNHPEKLGKSNELENRFS
ncbi:MAG TPA: hypothetical protein ACFYEF_00350 [Candidatus Wunengus sp. YC63]|uniref:hypothetical protein n=1 Tax=unclassified Candidatus Wunengus TaxID=3367695 RepID=UPI004025A97C